MLQECSSWAPKNGALQMFFSDTSEKHVFGCVARVYFYKFFESELRFVKGMRFSELKFIVK